MPASQDDEVAAFLAAYRATSRGARERWVRSLGIEPETPDYEPAKARYDALPFLSAPPLRALSHRALEAALGPAVNTTSSFPAMVWYGGATDTYGGHRFLGTIGDFVEHVLIARSTEVATKRAGWVVTPTSSADGHRANESTTAVHALNLDCDGSGTWDALLTVLHQLDIAHVAYQSGGYTPATPKWHILLPLAASFDTSSPEKCEAWKRAYHLARIVFGVLGGLRGEGFDPTVEAPSVPVFVTERRQASDPTREVVFHPGRALDLEALCAALPDVPQEIIEERASRPAPDPEAPLDDVRFERVVQVLCRSMSPILSSRRDLYLALPGALLDRGIAADDVRTIVEEVSLRCPGDPRYSRAEVAAKHREHLHSAETTIDKYERGGIYTRIGTIVERWPEVAESIDELFPDPRVTSFLEGLERRRSGGSAEVRAPYPATVSLGDLRKCLVARRRWYRRRSKARDDIIRTAILDAMIEGDDITPRAGEDLVAGEDGRVVDRSAAIRIAARIVADIVVRRQPAETPFEVVRENVRHCLSASLADGESVVNLFEKFERAFRRALGGYLRREDRRQAESVRERLARVW